MEVNKYKRILVLAIIIAMSELIFITILIDNKIKMKDCKKVVITKEVKSKDIRTEIINPENYHNAPYRLELKSAYGDNDAFHPKVYNFKEPWNGYKYWMAFSPYPNGDDGKENPHIKVSNDLVNWTEPKGFKNPLEEAPKGHSRGWIYNSDPHLTYNYDTDTLECYYRMVDDSKDKVIIYRKTTKDGVNWSEKEEILKATRSKKDYLSPAIIYEDGIYKMWSVDKGNTVKYMESKDGYNYENERIIELKYQLSTLKTWHLDVIHTEKGYELIAVAYTSWDDRLSMNLYYFKSEDNIKYSNARVILRPSVSSWDNRGIYRSSLIYEGGVYYLYYSAMSRNLGRGIGLSYGSNINNLKGYNLKGKTKLG